jgi:heme/copper-type cytochrome/quinol oxidase subunit 2
MSSFLADLIFWISAVCCVIAQIALVRSAVRAPMREPGDTEVALPRRSSEIAWTIVPAIALVLLLIATWRAMHTTPMHDMPGMTSGQHMMDT